MSSMLKTDSGMWVRITRSVFVQQGTGIKHDVQQPVSDAYKSTYPKISQLVPRELNKLLYWKDSMNQSAGEASDCCRCCSFTIKSAKKAHQKPHQTIFTGIFNLRQRPFQPAASGADDLSQRAEHLTQEVLPQKSRAHLVVFQHQQKWQLIGFCR